VRVVARVCLCVTVESTVCVLVCRSIVLSRVLLFTVVVPETAAAAAATTSSNVSLVTADGGGGRDVGSYALHRWWIVGIIADECSSARTARNERPRYRICPYSSVVAIISSAREVFVVRVLCRHPPLLTI